MRKFLTCGLTAMMLAGCAISAAAADTETLRGEDVWQEGLQWTERTKFLNVIDTSCELKLEGSIEVEGKEFLKLKASLTTAYPSDVALRFEDNILWIHRENSGLTYPYLDFSNWESDQTVSLGHVSSTGDIQTEILSLTDPFLIDPENGVGKIEAANTTALTTIAYGIGFLQGGGLLNTTGMIPTFGVRTQVEKILVPEGEILYLEESPYPDTDNVSYTYSTPDEEEWIWESQGQFRIGNHLYYPITNKYADDDTWIGIRKENGSVYAVQVKDDLAEDYEEKLIYDFNKSPGEIYKGYVSMHTGEWCETLDANLKVLNSREVTIFGQPKRVQKLEIPELADVMEFDPNPPATQWQAPFIPHIIVEDIGNVGYGMLSRPGFTVNPFTVENPAFEIDMPRLLSIKDIQSGAIIEIADMGLRAGNQLIQPNAHWEYFSTTPDADAVHYMSFGESKELDGQVYTAFYTEKAQILNRTTGVSEVYEYSSSNSPYKVWIRENLGEVYLKESEASDEIMIYDFASQRGDLHTFGTAQFTVSDIARSIVNWPASTGETFSEDVKTYSLTDNAPQESNQEISVTEFVGVVSEHGGWLTAPRYLDNESEVLFSSYPAADCSLSRVIREDSVLPIFETPVFQNSVSEFLKECNSLAIETESLQPAEYFTLEGIRVAEPQPGQLLIRRQGTKTDKVIF